MKRVVHKLFWAWDFEKEEQWLNKMSDMGLQLSDVSLGRYVFEEGAPGEYKYKLQMLDNMPNTVESQQYIKFCEETGAEHIASWMRWVYFRKNSDGKEFELFSDIDSRIKHIRGILTFLLVIGIAEFLILLSNLNNLFHYREPAFVIIVGLLFVVTMVIIYGAIRMWKSYRKLLKERNLHE
ncbi:MAG: DUF2812 domain-containing protein [Anaerolineaceae bacterium]